MSAKDVNPTIRKYSLMRCQYCLKIIGSTEDCPACETHRQLSAKLKHVSENNFVPGINMPSQFALTQHVNKCAKEAVDHLNDLAPGDSDIMHCLADKCLLKFLDDIGFKNVADAYRDADDRIGFVTS